MNRISTKWLNIGYLLGKGPNQLEELEDQYRGKASRCWCALMDDWLSDGGTSDYPATWEGLVSILEDIQCGQVAKELKIALASATSAAPPTSLPTRMEFDVEEDTSTSSCCRQ